MNGERNDDQGHGDGSRRDPVRLSGGGVRVGGGDAAAVGGDYRGNVDLAASLIPDELGRYQMIIEAHGGEVGEGSDGRLYLSFPTYNDAVAFFREVETIGAGFYRPYRAPPLSAEEVEKLRMLGNMNVHNADFAPGEVIRLTDEEAAEKERAHYDWYRANMAKGAKRGQMGLIAGLAEDVDRAAEWVWRKLRGR